ncbi:MAG TPA: chemotaxis protein CheB [Usitatibacter sp.]|nr:chemotaxis protein CheB [Usitatibacter sp.]
MPQATPNSDASAGDSSVREPSLAFPVVAIGASAGGIDAIKRLLEALAPDTGMAYVVIQHLSAAHESMLTEILARSTAMPVAEARDRAPIEPNHVYVIPPNAMLAFAAGTLALTPREGPSGQARAIDVFMRSLADGQGYKAIGVVLSGSASDGTVGLEEIKAAGGITFAQDSTAEQDSMPRSAIAAGVVDFVLPPDEIAHELVRLAHHPYVARGAVEPEPSQEPIFARVVEALRQSTGVDFSKYKRNTLRRRITRRMVLHRLQGFDEYLQLLESNPAELDALYADVLINVTSFFRDAAAFESLKSVVFPKLVEDRGRREPIRIWSVGCSTGEEAYSIAIAYNEFAEASGRRLPLQVFATDLNGANIDKARAGVYPKSIAHEVSAERLRRFFAKVDGGYRVAKPIRDLCVFARHNVLSDPPFSHVDLVACRNLLIYLEPALQQRIIRLLHYALCPGGFLWLGGSETIGTYRELFELLDARSKVYVRKPSAHPATLAMPLPGRSLTASAPLAAGPATREVPIVEPMREADRLLLSRYSPPGVLVNENLDVIQFRGDTGPFLTPAPGRATLELLKMLREGLLVAVRGGLRRAQREKVAVREEGLRVRSNGGWREVDLAVIPVHPGDNGFRTYLVLFEEPAARERARAKALADHARSEVAKVPASRDESSRQEIDRLTQEIAASREYLQSVIEQQEAANEELQSANEEVQSANEELQSINEELETSKEEIQSTNEELATVNDELQNRNAELSQSNNDFVNLLASVDMPIVMLGPDLRIRRFTPPAQELLNLIPSDVGRPLGDLTLDIGVADLEHIAIDVIRNVAPQEREIRDREGRRYLLRVRPYRTLENRIEGAVVLLVDIDSLRRAEQSALESERRFELLADTAPVPIWVDDLERCRFVNRAFEEFVGAKAAEVLERGTAGYVHPEDRAQYVDACAAALRERRHLEMRLRLRRHDGPYRWMKVVAAPRFIEDAQLAGFVGCAIDITDMAEAEGALRELDRGRNEFLAVLAHELRNPLAGVRNAAHLLATPHEPALVEHARSIIERQTQRMVRLIDDLLDVSRITHGKVQLRMEPVDLAAAAERVADATQAEREAMGQVLEKSLPAAPMFVSGDPVRIDQILTNLVSNASKFSERGGRIRLSIEPDAGPGPGAFSAVVRVRDDGRGIEASMLARVFDLFVQADPGRDRHTGIGLGLTIAKRLVELHGGTIEARSGGPGTGSEFIVRLPLIASAQAPGQAAKAAGESAKGSVRRRILVVDDDADAGESLRRVLETEGHDARLVMEGARAVEAAAQFGPDAVLLDIGLPDLDGYEVARALRADPRTRNLFIVAVTGYGREDDRANSLRAGMDLHMTKPVDVDALMRELAKGRPGAS